MMASKTSSPKGAARSMPRISTPPTGDSGVIAKGGGEAISRAGAAMGSGSCFSGLAGKPSPELSPLSRPRRYAGRRTRLPKDRPP